MLDNDSMNSEDSGDLMLKKRSKLFELINAGSKKRENWEEVINYLDENALENKKEDRKQISCSPLFQTKCTPNRDLQKELDIWLVDIKALTPLQLALSYKAPSSVIAALCHMFPRLASIPDKWGQLPLHLATRRPTGGSALSPGAEAHKVMMVLLETFPEGVVHRDFHGRTPLHILFMYHAESRTVQTVQHFMCPVPRKLWEKHAKVAFPSDLEKDKVIIPYTATSIPDVIHGCYPLHYAVMEGSSKEVIQTLIENYPNSQTLRDHAGRTPLHWYLGAAEGASVHSSPEELNLKEYPKYGTHHKTHRSTSIISLLLSSSIASQKDSRMKRTPLHCAASLLALSIFDPNPLDTATTTTSSPSKNEPKRARAKVNGAATKMFGDANCMSIQCLLKIINANPSALTMTDLHGQTPLHLFFSTVHNWNHTEYQELLQIVLEKKMDLQSAHTHTGVEMRMRARHFSPPIDIVNLLIYGRTMRKISKKGISITASVDSEDSEDNEPDCYASHDATNNQQSQNSIKDVIRAMDDEDDDGNDLIPTEMPDHYGMLPLHLAVLTVIPVDVMETLITSNPSSMIHNTFNMEKKIRKDQIFKRTPLHLALSSPYTSSLYTWITIQPLLQEHQKQPFLKDDLPHTNQGNVKVDGTLALEMKDDTGRYPLHLAAEHNASLEILQKFYDLFPKAVSSTNRDGDLPVHLVLDKFGLFDNIQLAIAQYESKKQTTAVGSNPFDNQSYTKIVALAKKQHSTNRLSSLGFGGAVIAPTRGWTSDEEDAERKKEKLILLQKLYLLLEPLCDNQSALVSASSRHNMTPLHIAIAFHCLPYPKLHKMLQAAPQAVNARTKLGQYTPLDLHMLRKRVPGEISPDEKDAWEVIRELLFSYDLYPISIKGNDNRIDRDLLERCTKIIRAGIEGQQTVHSKNNHPIDPSHSYLGFENYIHEIDQSGEKDVEGKENTQDVLGDIAKRLWTFFVSFTNPSDPKDHYAIYVQKVLENLDFNLVQELVYMRLPDYAIHAYGTTRNISGLTILDVANVYCKSVIHKCFYFAGLYDFTPPLPRELDHGGSGTGESILLHRGNEGKTLLLRATEFQFFTEEKDDIDLDGGDNKTIKLMDANEDEGMEVDVNEVVVAGIDSDDGEENHIKSNFRITSQGVCIKLFKDESNYKHEINARSILGENNFIVPLLADYDSTSSSREGDRQFNHDIRGSRFRNLPLYSCLEKGNQQHSVQAQGSTKDLSNSSPQSKHNEASTEIWRAGKATGLGQGWVDISDYPYSIVMPLASRSNLGDMFTHDAINNIDSFRDLTINVGQALQFMHSKGIIFGNFSMNNLISVGNLSYNKQRKLQNWLLTDLTSCRAMRIKANGRKEKFDYFGGIPLSGIHTYDCSTFPPEMFTKVDNTALEMYEDYWKKVSEIPNSNVPWSLVKPFVDPTTREKYVIKFFCEINPSKSEKLPPLPYDLVKCTESHDVWAFGAFLFTLCSGGNHILNSNSRNGLLDSTWERIVNWNVDVAEQLIFDHVENFVAQDLLLHILVDVEERSDLSMEAVLSHPFFFKPETMSKGVKQAMTQIRKEREAEQNARKQSKEKIRLEEKERIWVEDNIISLNRLTLESQLRFANSTTGLLMEAFNLAEKAPHVPVSLITLPYKLARNKLGKLTPATKKDVQLAEIIGKHFFHLNKACVLTHKMEEMIQQKPLETIEKWVKLSAVDENVTGKEIAECLGIQKEPFAQLISSLVSTISINADFSSKPLFYCRSIVRKSIQEFLSIFSDVKKGFLYLVDEVDGKPIVPKDSEETVFPYSFDDHSSETVLKLLPFMYACVLQTRIITKSVSGLVRLIFEAAYPHSPPSWVAYMAGLSHNVKREQIVSEIRVLCESIREMSEHNKEDEGSGKEQLAFLKEKLTTIDSEKVFDGLKYVTDRNGYLWMSKLCVERLKKEGEIESLNKEHDTRQMIQEQLRLKDVKLIELEKTLKEMELQLKIQGGN